MQGKWMRKGNEYLFFEGDGFYTSSISYNFRWLKISETELHLLAYSSQIDNPCKVIYVKEDDLINYTEEK